MKVFLSISFLVIIFLCSCSSYKFPNATGSRVIPTTAVNSYFIDTAQTSIYRCKINAFKKDLNGTLVIKTLSADEHRVALLSDFGQTVFDISILPNSYEAHYVMDDLNKKLLLKELSSLFRTLTQQQYSQESLLFAETQHWPVYVVGKSYYQYKERQLSLITWVLRNKARAEIAFTDFNGAQAQTIHIAHKRFPLTIELLFDAQQSEN